MIPKRVSASSLATAEECLARYKAESMNYAANPSDSIPAMIGSSVHYGLEHYVKMVYMDKTAPASIELLLSFYLKGYMIEFKTSDTDTDAYRDGEDMTRTWFERTDLSDVTVLSVEKKEYRSFPTSIGPMDLTYIFDRLDMYERDGKKYLRVVDYKTVRAFISADDISRKIQARLYAMAIYMKMQDDPEFMHLGIDTIVVQLDLLRHRQVGAIFSVAENRETYRWMRERTERIIATPDDQPTPETIGYGCRYCVRRAGCLTLRSNVDNDGILSMSVDQMVVAREQLKHQESAAKIAAEEIDKVLLKHVSESNVFEIQTEGFKVSAQAKRETFIDAAKVVEIVGAETIAMAGNVGVTLVKKLIKDKSLTPEQREQLEATMSIGYGEAKIKVEKTGGFIS